MSDSRPSSGFTVSDKQADACQCALCQSPFIVNGRKALSPEPCAAPIARAVLTVERPADALGAT